MGEGGGGRILGGTLFTDFCNQDDIQFDKFWYAVRWYKGELEERIHDNTTKDSVTVTSSNISQNDETIWISKILKS